jgi:hypothetical protein
MLLFKKYQTEHINMGHSFERLSVISPSIKINNNFIASLKVVIFVMKLTHVILFTMQMYLVDQNYVTGQDTTLRRDFICHQ